MDLSSPISDHCDRPLVAALFVDHEAAGQWRLGPSWGPPHSSHPIPPTGSKVLGLLSPWKIA
jgi:hypothetical protein